MVLLAICAGMARGALVSAGLHLLLLCVRWDETLPDTSSKQMEKS